MENCVNFCGGCLGKYTCLHILCNDLLCGSDATWCVQDAEQTQQKLNQVLMDWYSCSKLANPTNDTNDNSFLIPFRCNEPESNIPPLLRDKKIAHKPFWQDVVLEGSAGVESSNISHEMCQMMAMSETLHDSKVEVSF